MQLVLAGSRYFGASVFEALRREAGVEIRRVIVPAADDRLALAAAAAGVDVHVLENPKIVPGAAIPAATDLIVAAHTHARVSEEALRRTRLGGVGYHPSLLPRHRGIAAVEWTILEGDAVAGGSVYHLADGWDAGAIAAQDWCFVGRGETARELWERALAPMGIELLTRVVHHAREHGSLPAKPQDERFATRAPMIRRAVVLTESAAPASTALIVTVMGADRPGIVSLLAAHVQRHGANWAASRLARLAGEFAGMIHLEVPHENVDRLAEAMRGLESSGLHVVISRSDVPALANGLRGVGLRLIGDDRPGIVSKLTRILAESGVSIEQLQTEIVDGQETARFEVEARLLVPAALSSEALHKRLAMLAHELMLDIALDEEPAG